MILASVIPFELGRNVTKPGCMLFDPKGKPIAKDQPFFVLRVATREEWLADLSDRGILVGRESLEISSRPTTTFYEIIAD